MKSSPSITEFLIRVGGFFSIVLLAIALAKLFYPGSEAIASMMACAVGITVLIVEHINKRSKTFKSRIKKRR